MIINGIKVNYKQYGKKNAQNIVLLHGWGQNTKMMDPIGKGLEENFYITNVDLPGFGESDEPITPISLDDYYEIVKELLINLKVKNPILIGHSFGGKIAIIYAAKEKVQKLILLGSPFRKTQKKPSLKVKIYKQLAKIPLLKTVSEKMKNKLGSTDYRNASPVMKKVLVNSIHSDLVDYLKMIEAPTLLIWGTNDTEVSVEDAKYAEKIMKNAGLIIFQNRSHYAYLEELDRTLIVLKEFFKKDEVI